MPASLTVQVRLGFSMGWRIWTPNEVGFYAKTLAHSYFILVILKSKFLKELIWIVNYNLFMGSRKYHVFVEFLKFGMKSKEERSFWKKIIYISLVARHRRLTKRFFHLKDEKHKLNMYRTIIEMRYQQRRDRVILLRRYESDIFKKSCESLISVHKKRAKNITIRNDRIRMFNKIRFNRSPKLNILSWRSLVFLKVTATYKKSSNARIFKKINKFLRIKPKGRLGRFGDLKSKVPFFTKNATTVSRKPAVLGLFGKKEVGSLIGLGNPSSNISRSEKAIMEGFRLDPVFERYSYSICGGPRKRLSRNLRRAFQGKHVKHVSGLVWYWEKLSRMLTYYMQKHDLSAKRVF